MHNTVDWDSGPAFWFLFFIMLPIVIHFLGGIMSGIPDEPEEYDPSPERPWNPPSINVSINLPNFKGSTEIGTTHKPKKAAKSRSKQPKPKPKQPEPSPQPATDDVVISESVGGLCHLGFKKGEARKLVKSLCSKKKYNSAESLIRDALCV